MPRPRKIDPPRQIKISIPSSLAGEIELRLFSDLQGRVPLGEWSKFFETLARQAIAQQGATNGTDS